MFNKNTISTLRGIVGWRQPDNPDYAILDAENLASTSGYYVNENPFVKVEFLKDNQDYKDADNIQFNDYLKQIQDDSIGNVCNYVFRGNDYYDRQVLYAGPLDKTETDPLVDGWVGEEIILTREKSVAFTISRVILDFQGTGTIRLQLYNSNQLAPVFSQDIDITTDRQVEELNWVVNDNDPLYKGVYYLGYLTQGLTVVPYSRRFKSGNVQACITNLSINTRSFPGHNTETLFDVNGLSGYSNSTGVNPDITVYNDYTDLILNNKFLFAKAIQLDMQIKSMNTYISSLRSNRNQRISELDLVIADKQVNKLQKAFEFELKELKLEIEKLKKGFGLDPNSLRVNTLT